jgi:hypothetical protein
MRKNSIKIPKSMAWLFWSYDLESLDLRVDKEYIVTQVLNYGKWEDVQWLFRVYRREEIVDIVKNPRRGSWFPDVLNYWQTIFGIRVRKDIAKRAIRLV